MHSEVLNRTLNSIWSFYFSTIGNNFCSRKNSGPYKVLHFSKLSSLFCVLRFESERSDSLFKFQCICTSSYIYHLNFLLLSPLLIL